MEPVTKNEMKYEMDKAFAAFEKKMDAKLDARFEQQNRQIAEMLDGFVRHMDERFEMLNRRIDSLRAAQADFAHIRQVDQLSDRVTLLERKIA